MYKTEQQGEETTTKERKTIPIICDWLHESFSPVRSVKGCLLSSLF